MGETDDRKSDESTSSDAPPEDIPPRFLHEIPDPPPKPPLTPADAYNRKQWRIYWTLWWIGQIVGVSFLIGFGIFLLVRFVY